MKYSRIFSIILVVVLISQLLIPVVYSSATSPYIWIRYAHTRIPAVTTIGGNETGTVADLYVSVAYPGNGIVYFSAEPLTELDTQATARIAALVASTIAGKSFTAYDFFIRIKSPSLIIGGPSAGAAMTVAILSIFLNQTLNESVMMTGMVCPDGSVGPVGGIPAKLEAAAASGIKVFLIPVGQRVVYEREIVKEPIPGGYIIRTKYTPVDLVELGKKLNVTVIEVASIRQAFYYFTGLNISLNMTNTTLPSLPANVTNIINSWMQDYLKRADDARKETLNLVSKIPYPIKYVIEKHLNNSVNLEKEAYDYWNQSQYYQAASAAFTSYIEARTALEYSKIYLDNTRLIQLSDEVNSTLDAVRTRVMNYNPTTLTGFEAAATARYRYYLAELTYNDSVNIIKNGISSWSDLDRVVYLLVYSEARADSALKWLDLGSVESPVFNKHALESIAETLIGIARSSFAYLETLAGDLGSKPPSYDEALTNVNLAEQAYASDDYYGTIAASIHATAASVVAIHELFKTAISNIVQVVGRESIASIREAYDMGVLPLVALSYLETAKAQGNLQENWATVIYYYMLASLYSQVLKTLVEASIPRPTLTTTITAPPTFIVTKIRTVTATETVTETTTVTTTATTTLEKTATITETNTVREIHTTTITSTTTSTKEVVRMGFVTVTQTNLPISDYLGYLVLELLVGVSLGIIVIGVIFELRKRRK